MRWLDVITESVDLSLNKPGDGGGQRSLVCCSPWGHKESDMTRQLNGNNMKIKPSKTSESLQKKNQGHLQANLERDTYWK